MQAGGAVADYTYDANGNRVQQVKGLEYDYTWDSLGRLLGVQAGDGFDYPLWLSQLAYDAQGRVVEAALQQYDSGNSTWGAPVAAEYYLWDGDELLEQRTVGPDAGNLTLKYFDEGFQTVNNGTVTGNYYYTRDHLGSIREVVAGDGQTVEGRFDYNPWGQPTWMDYSGGTVPEPNFAYAGYFQSASLWDSLYLTRYRAYDWQTHQWLSRDPIGEAGGINLYGYAGNDPVNKIDPEGLLAIYGNSNGQYTITTSSGKTYQHSGAQNLQADLTTITTNGESVANFTVRGHGSADPDTITIGGAVLQVINGSIYLTPVSGNQTSIDVTTLLMNAMSAKPTINLWGCNTAHGNNNIANDFHLKFPNATVSGYSTYGVGGITWGVYVTAGVVRTYTPGGN